MGLTSEYTTFSLDNLGRFLCNTIDEAIASTNVTVAGKRRDFDAIVIGGGTFGAVFASSLFLNDTTHSRRILVLEAGPFTLPEHFQNLPYQGGTPDWRKPWDSHPALKYQGLLFTIGGRSLAWGGWSPQLLLEELTSDWPQTVIDDLRNKYFQGASDQIGVTATNDFIFGRLHNALRMQLFKGMGSVPLAVPLANLPDHPAILYRGDRVGQALAAAASAGGSVMASSPSAQELRDLLGLDSTDTSSTNDLLNMAKLEAPLAVQSRAEPGLFPFNKFSAVPVLTTSARIASKEADGIDASGDARKRLMIVPNCRVLDIITETQPDNWVRVTGVRVLDRSGAQRTIPVAPRENGHQSIVAVALGTIESTGLAKRTFQESLSWRAAQRMGQNLIAHLRSNLTIRVPVTSLDFLTSAQQKALQTSALFVKGKKKIADKNGTLPEKDRYYHLQITASGLGRFGDDSEAELFKKIPDVEHLGAMLQATDTQVVITIRGIGEMTPHNPDSFIRLSPGITENDRAVAEVTLADVKGGSATSAQSDIDMQSWEAMDDLADQVALVFGNKKAFEVLFTKRGPAVQVGPSATAADLKNAHPHADRRDDLGTTHHDAGTLWMGTDPATSVTNEFGRIHDTTNCYVAAPAIFPALGSPNPMLTGVALARRTAEMLQKNVLPGPAARTPDPGFTALFDGTTDTYKNWKLVNRKDSGQGFTLLNGELVSYGQSDFALLYYAPKTFNNFQLRLQFKMFDPANCNSGVFVRFRDPMSAMPAELKNRATNEHVNFDNLAWTAVFSGFEVQIDDNARGDTTKDFYGRFPEPDGLYKNRTGAIYKIPAGDFIFHLGFHDVALQTYTPGPPLQPGVWFQYDIVATGNHYEVTLTNTATGVSQLTTAFDNTDVARGHLDDGTPGGYIGIQSYPFSPMAFRDIWIK